MEILPTSAHLHLQQQTTQGATDMAQRLPSVAQDGYIDLTEDAPNTPMHEAEGSSTMHTDSPQLAESHQDVTPLPTNNYPPWAFHQQNPAYLYLGRRRSDNRQIWLGMTPRNPSVQQPLPRDFNPEKISIRPSEIDWIDAFQLQNFFGTTLGEKEVARQLHLRALIRLHVAGLIL